MIAHQPSLFDLPEPAPFVAPDLQRVSSRIGAAVLAFCRSHREFHAGDLHAHVERATGVSAPASADRILRDLRQRGVVRYRVVNRRESLYEVLDIAAEAFGDVTGGGV